MATTLNVIKTITIRGTAEGVTEVERQLESLAGAMEEVTVASGQQERATLSVERAYQKLQSRYDQEFRAQQNLAQVQKTLQAAQAQGLVTQERASELMQAAIRTHNTITPAVNAYGNATKGARYELLNLSRQLQDVGVGLASGQALFTVAIQQGTQIADVFSTASASGRNLGKEILALITPFRALVVGMLALVGGSAALVINLANTEKQLFELSQRIDTPIEKLRTLQNVAAGQLNLKEFIEGIQGFGDEVDRAKLGLGNLAELFRRNGQAAGDMEKSLLNIAELIKNAATGQQQYRILQEAGLPATAAWVNFLRQGRESLQAAIKDAAELNSRNEEIGRSAQAFNEAWSKAWDNFKRNAQNAVVAAGSFIGGLITKAGEAVLATQQKVLELRGFTPEQALRQIGRGALATGVGTQLTPEDAAKFYENIRLAGQAVSKLNADTSQLAQREIQRVQVLGTLATLDEVASAKRLELNELEAKQGIALGRRKETLVEIARIEEQSRRSGAVVGALGEAATATEEYTAALDRLNVVNTQQLLTQEQYRRGLINIKTGMQDVRAFSSSFANSAVSGLTDIATGAKSASEAFKNFGNQVLASLTQMILKITLFNQLEKSLTGAIGGFLPTPTPTSAGPVQTPVTTVGVAHSGGVIGVDTFPRVAAHPALWNDAPHFQSGGLVGGVPIIAHTGEGIFTPGQMRAMGGQVVNVNVENNAPVAVTTEQTRGGNGEMNVKLIIDQVESRMADNMRRGRGPMSAATASRFGLNAARGNSVSG